MIIFLLFSFLFLQPSPETQAFASFDEISKNNAEVSSDWKYSTPDSGSIDSSDGDDGDNKEGIEEDWMFGKIRLS